MREEIKSGAIIKAAFLRDEPGDLAIVINRDARGHRAYCRHQSGTFYIDECQITVVKQTGARGLKAKVAALLSYIVEQGGKLDA